jgi:uncharacterized membrane protein YphA (DoxX/SURF4 family)
MTGGEDLALLGGRVLLALMFVVSEVDKFRLDQTEIQQIASLNLPASYIWGGRCFYTVCAFLVIRRTNGSTHHDEERFLREHRIHGWSIVRRRTC